MDKPEKKNGLGVLVGRSNVGKSTLLNSLVGTKVAITSPKPQTTRHVIHGVIHDERGQIVIADTPGIFKHAPDRLTSILNEKVREALAGVDAVIYVVDPTRYVGEEEKMVHRMVAAVKQPKILVLNKSDVKQPFRDEYLAWKDEFNAMVEVSALQAKSMKALVNAIFDVLPAGQALYPPGQLTNIENKMWVEELIREKVFLKTHEEVPYTTTVEVEEIAKRENGLTYIKAAVLTTSPRYKKMIIGAGAKRIRDIGTAARKELESVSGQKVFIDLEVRVEERWQEKLG